MRSSEMQGLSRRVQGSRNEGRKKSQGFLLPALPGVGTMASTMGLEISLEGLHKNYASVCRDILRSFRGIYGHRVV